MLIVLHCDYCREERALNVSMEIQDSEAGKQSYAAFRLKMTKRLLFCDMACARQWLASDMAEVP